MRVLVIAPDQPGIDTLPEIRSIQRRHHMSILGGIVKPQDIYDACRDTRFDVHHYATHSGLQGALLSDGVLFTEEDIAQVARMKGTGTLFFNSCESGRLASYAVRHGVRFAIHTNIDLDDRDAWKSALSFYGYLENGHSRDIVGAYVVADNGDGDYGLQISPPYVIELQQRAEAAILPRPGTMIISRVQMVLVGVGILAASGLWTVILNALSGR